MDAHPHSDFPKSPPAKGYVQLAGEETGYAGFQRLKQAWKTAIQNPFFCWNSLLSLIAGIILVYLTQLFFPYIQQRQGVVLYDPLLEWLPAHNTSMLLFVCLYVPMLVWISMLVNYPRSLLQVVMSIIILQTIRLVTIWAIPLDPPQHCIILRDPLVYALAYHHMPITRDLFFSGHTATMMVFYLAAPRQKKWLLATWMGTVILLLLIQHAHYSIDILAAILISPAVWTWMEFYLSRPLGELTTWNR
jgi:hypothetical protein